MAENGNLILDLCAGTGSWSKPYKDNGYNVKVLTLPYFDVTQWKNSWVEDLIRGNDVYGVLAAPPCTMFSLARTKAKKLRDLEEGMRVVRSVLDIIWVCMERKQETRHKKLPLKFWALENPNGMLKYFLGKPAFEFNPYDFGDGYKKRTHLWGWFNEPRKIFCPDKSLNPETISRLHLAMKKFDMLASKNIHPEMFGKLTRQERRAITPQRFAEAFYEANK